MLCSSSLFAATNPVIYDNVSIGLQIINSTSFFLFLVIVILAIAYFVCHSLWRRTIILLSITAAISFGVSNVIEQLDYITFHEQQRHQVEQQSSSIRSRLENQIQTNLEISKALVIYMKSKDFQFTKDEFNAISKNIVETNPHIRHLALAKDLIVNMVYPVTNNAKAIGLNYRSNAEQWPMVKKSIENRKSILAGPVNLVQGGVAFIGRIPIFYEANLEKPENDLWGLLSVIIDMNALFDSAELSTYKDINIAIRGTDAMGEKGNVFYGDGSIFNNDSIKQIIKLPSGSWQLALIPKLGWTSDSPDKVWIRSSVIAFYLLTALFIIFRATQHIKLANSNEKLRAEIAERHHLESEQHLLNRQLHQAQKLEAIGKLTGGIAHDFNNILAAINGYAQLAQMNVQKNPRDDKSAKYLTEVIKAGDRAKHLVQQMLTFSRGEEIEAQVIYPYQIIQETISMLESTIPSSIKLVTHYDDTECKIKSDSNQFQQIILNLIVNSRDAITAQMGEITVSQERVTISNVHCSSCNESISDQYVKISIKDNGLGIPEQHFQHVFEPFYTSKEVGKGTGMGLSVVHGIVHASDGHIILHSKINFGTTIDLLFPVVEEAITDTDEAVIISNESAELSQGHVLIVDDEVAITELISDLADQMNIKSTCFTNPEEALAFYNKHYNEITLVISDQTMPLITGVELVQQMRALKPSLPFVLCSGYSDVIDEGRAKTLGINNFLSKPVDIAILKENIIKFHH